MRNSCGKTAVAFLTAGVCALGVAAPSDAQIAFTPCADSNDFACGHLSVPLDPSGASPGTITLAIRRRRAPVGEEKSAVIALAGGPGQAALPFAEQSVGELGAILATRDLIVFDQRGTGFSHRLSCHSFEQSNANDPPGSAVSGCAEQIGPSRTFFTTADSVADIEAIRVAGGYEKLVLYGTSYGTKLAELYAQRYPGRVEALVLDSVVPPNGPDPLSRATFAAVPRILRQLCAARACAHISPSPIADLSNLIRRLEKRRRRARWIDGRGRGHMIAISSDVLVEILIQGDLEPTLRAEFPAAVRSAVHGDDAPLARLLARARSSEEGENEGTPEGFDSPLYYATTCEEDLFPWSRAADPGARLAEARAHIRGLGASAFGPFTTTNVMDLSDMPACAFWPFTTPAPTATQAPLPSVPTLILSGADDLRTPTANAREVAAKIPGAKLLVVPNTGHSVLDSDPTGCSNSALEALFAAKPVKACAPTPPRPLLRPTPVPPAVLSDIAPARGNHGRPGRTIAAVLLTLLDFGRQLEVHALAQLGSGSASALGSLNIGGLRSGWAEFTARRIVLSRYSYVPGVTLSGVITAARTSFSVGGRAAAHGRLRIGAHGTLTGFLDGSRVSVSAAAPSASAAWAAAAGVQSTVAARAARRR